MSLNNKQYSIDSLAEITKDGFTAAMFPQIRNAVAQKMMDIYGYDIDISSASADGQYINMEALVLNNIYRALESIQSNIEPASASGKYLDILASFSNTRRIRKSYSTVPVKVKYTGSATPNKPDSITCIDRSGNEWVWINPVNWDSEPQIDLEPNADTVLTFTCKTIGPVEANPGDIYQTLNVSDYIVTNETEAVVGNDDEPDSSLRSRRITNFGLTGTTVTNSLKARLLNEAGIKDVYVFNNNTGINQIMSDGTVVNSHDIYVAVRKKEGATIPSYNIASIIFNTLTPGVLTTRTETTENYKFNVDDTLGIGTTVSWKESEQISDVTITIKYNLLAGIDLSVKQQNLIISHLSTYLSNVSIAGTVRNVDLIREFNGVDLKTPLTGYNTYAGTACYFGDDQNQITYTMPLDYFRFSPEDFIFVTDDNGDTGTLTIAHTEGANS